MTEPERPAPSSPAVRARRTRFDAAPAKHKRGPSKTLVVVGAALLGLGALIVYYRLYLSDSARHHEFTVDWPVAAPRGAPLVVGHELKAGDVFERRIESHFRILLSVDDSVDIRHGMNLDVGLLLSQSVDAAPPGSGAALRSTWKLAVEKSTSNPPVWSAGVAVYLGGAGFAPFRLDQDLDATGQRVGPAIGGATPKQRQTLDSVLSGLGDLTTNYLPPRDVRLGEVWALDEAVKLPGIESVVRYVANTDDKPTGYPAVVVTGKVAAEALETRDSESCLRLRLVVYVTQEGDATPPATPGRLSTAAKIDGHVWVSMSKGIIWEQDMVSEILTSYLRKVSPIERHATAKLTAKTKRAEKPS